MFRKIIATVIIVASVYWSYRSLMPVNISSFEAATSEFSTERALVHLKEIAKEPHYTSNKAHKEVRDYIVKQLQELGLEVELQEGYSITKWRNLTKPVNILSRIKGKESGKALMLMSHYDSNPHSSYGASDAGSGVATILEGIRAFLSKEKTPKNDIIILITDAEELGLNGADLFVNNHPWAEDVGLAINLEARGSGGPSYMLVETNGGNAKLIANFQKAGADFPVANSLTYSIYKMLPNDTDLTIFREDGDINGFNFAFIDDHYDYHSALDNYKRLNRNTLEHQGSYLMPILEYFSNAELTQLDGEHDLIYFNVPLFKLITYPFSWVWSMFVLAVIIFVVLLFHAKRKERINLKEVIKGFFSFFGAMILSVLVAFLGWKLLLVVYPHYGEILHGFTYNGHTYIWMFVWLTLGISFLLYHWVYSKKNVLSLMVAPLAFWLLINGFISYGLQGASFFIIPVYFTLFAFHLMIRQQRPNLVTMAVLTAPMLLIFSPFIKMFPVGLGLKMLMASSFLIVIMLGLMLPVVGNFRRKNLWSYFFFAFAAVSFVKAHINADFDEQNPKPNSLIYLYDCDLNQAHWLTYDLNLDLWTNKLMGKDLKIVDSSETFGSKYGTGFTFQTPATVQKIEKPNVEILTDTIIGDARKIVLKISSNRNAERMELFSQGANVFDKMEVNGLDFKHPTVSSPMEKERRLLSYFVVDDEPLLLRISIPKDQKTKLTLYEATFNLLEDERFAVPKRPTYMIPKPFVLNDAIVLKKEIRLD